MDNKGVSGILAAAALVAFLEGVYGVPADNAAASSGAPVVSNQPSLA